MAIVLYVICLTTLWHNCGVKGIIVYYSLQTNKFVFNIFFHWSYEASFLKKQLNLTYEG